MGRARRLEKEGKTEGPSGIMPLVAIVVALCVLAVAFVVRSSGQPPTPPPSNVTAAPTPAPAAAAPKIDPNDIESFVRVGNVHYDRKEYAQAIDLYTMYLKVKPENSDVRTDMATAIWYSGNPDRALQEFQVALKFQPTHRQAMWNTGIVQWQGKKNHEAALEAWRKLLAAHPNDPQRKQVEDLIKEVEVEQLRGVVQQQK